MFIYWFVIMDILRDTDEKPDEELHMVKSGRIPSTRASFPLELRHIGLPSMEMC